MSPENVVVQQPQGQAEQLVLLFHGVGDNPVSMGEIGRYFIASFPHALIVSIGSPFACDLGQGRQWFSVQGVTEHNRHQRIAESMPLFVKTVRDWQQRSGVKPADTVLIGFSQGSIMSLESTKVEQNLAGRIVSFSGRFASLPETAIGAETKIHFIHGQSDPVIAANNAVIAAERLQELGNACTLDLAPKVAHGISPQMIDAAISRLKAD
ncbi:esterase [Rouxiella badensis]|jgi:phospholipase/carboxylesterase|uniref:Esterase n=1 Tax=Rouxiella badensis TaxID=1646377 RepID=A0A1X0WA74_9GAMM|nr:esterase [Rouxiella badensis]MCC3705307.1 esterase [Rouxiella badensis]MCC3719156.1 esterase [Rouxiella badensis]MCC3729210.1 esterase [Rouxiella badensis]MCC3733790.1 esterase [Rouxiella badensis]MCC3740777.1 esterase [Rouxiella badensis]